MNPEAWIALAAVAITVMLAVLGAVVWLVRLEGRVNAAKAALEALDKEIVAIKARAEAEAAAHTETTVALVRVQEQLKHLTNLFERQFITPEPRRRAPKVTS